MKCRVTPEFHIGSELCRTCEFKLCELGKKWRDANPKTRYVLLEYYVRDGESKYYKKTTMTDNTRRRLRTIAKEYLGSFFGDKGYTVQDTSDEDVWWIKSGETAVKLVSIEEISKADYDILKKHRV